MTFCYLNDIFVRCLKLEIYETEYLTLKQPVIFSQNVILFSNDVHNKCNTSCMKLAQYIEYLISSVDTDDLVL